MATWPRRGDAMTMSRPAVAPHRRSGRSRRLVLALGLLLAAPLLLAPPPTAAAATDRFLAISTASASPLVPFKDFDTNVVKVYDIDRDGDLEIVAQNDNQYVYVFDSHTGAILFQAKTKLPAGWGARSFNGPEVAIMENGGVTRLVVANSAAYLTSFRFDLAASSSTSFTFVKEWERRLSECYPGDPSTGPGMDSKPVLVDLDRDGSLEILGSTEELGVYAVRANGQLFWKRCIGGGNAEPSVGDVNGDGWPDVVFASDGGVVTAMNGLTGATRWSYDVKAAFGLGSGSMPVGPGVGQLDGLGGDDVVVGARDSHDPANFSNDHAVLVALDGAGRLLWGRQDPEGNPLTYTRAIIADAADDGAAEVYWADWNTNGHKAGIPDEDAWKVTGPAHFYRYAANGTMEWRQTLATYWSNKDLALADVDADGVQEVLANGPGSGGDGIWYLDSNTGAKEAFVPTAPWKVMRGPIVADLWDTGTMQWVVAAAANSPDVSGGAILVYDTHSPYSAKWPHLPDATPAPAPPPPAGRFNATFTIKNPNAWWQELTVRPATPTVLAKVEVRLGGGPWQPMTFSSWGAWTSSYNAPAGTRVEFLATSGANFVSQSAPFTWLDATRTVGSVTPAPPPPPSNPLQATFTVPAGVSETWVEVRVETVRTLAGVSASVDGGSPVALAKQSWGNWAKGFFVATGSQVRFTATDVDGNTNRSALFAWPPPPPPPPPTFAANVSVTRTVNEWWVEVIVTANRPVAGVEATVNGGAPVALAKQNWGNWAKSFFVERGSTVRFRAVDGAGASFLSANVSWLGAFDSGPFAATFKPLSVTNNWWVEVKVTANHPVVLVEAQVNGAGSWIALPKTSWGSNAKSFFVADGASMQFRATDGSGATSRSDAVAWG